MTLSVRDVLRFDVLAKAQVIAGEQGLERRIAWVSIIEVLDDINSLQDGDLLVTTALGLKDDPVLKQELIPFLVKRRVAAMIIQTGYYLDEIPPEIIAQCNELDFPLLRVTKEFMFADLTKAVAKRIINLQTERLEYSQHIHQRLTEVILRNGGLLEVAKVLSGLINCPVRVFDSYFNLLSHHGLNDKTQSLILPENIQAEYLALAQTHKLELRAPHIIMEPYERVHQQVLHPLIAGGRLHGYISAITSDKTLGELDMLAIASAAVTCTLELLKEKAVWEAEERIKGDFLDDLLDENFSAGMNLQRRAQYLGYDLSKSFVVMTVGIDNIGEIIKQNAEEEFQEMRQQLLSSVRSCLQTRKEQALIKFKSDKVVILLPTDEASAMKDAYSAGEAIRAAVKGKLPFTVSVGIGCWYNDASSVAASYRESERVLAVVDCRKRQDVVLTYNELGYYRIFVGGYNKAEQDRFYKTTIQPLATYDEKHKSNLVETLDTYLNKVSGFNEAARRLFIHRHTLKYRLERIKEITGLDTENPQHRFELQLGLVVGELIKKCNT